MVNMVDIYIPTTPKVKWLLLQLLQLKFFIQFKSSIEVKKYGFVLCMRMNLKLEVGSEVSQFEYLYMDRSILLLLL
jgi:hypothetical protein